MKVLTCLRPIPQTGSSLRRRDVRDQERTRDSMRCLCGGENCRDAELKEKD